MCNPTPTQIASRGFWPVNRVTSPFRAATTAGNRTLCPQGATSPGHTVSQRPVEALHDALVLMVINTPTSNRNSLFRQHLADCAHELSPRVNLEKLGPLQWPPSVDPRQGIGDLCCGLASQRLSLFVAAGDVNDRESIAKGLPPHAAMQQKEQVSFMDLVWLADIKLRARDVASSHLSCGRSGPVARLGHACHQ